jgi:hypothetical protein
MLLGSAACGDLVGTATLPPGTQSPNTYNTPAGALGVYLGVKSDLQLALRGAIPNAGLLADELTAAGLGRSADNIGAIGNLTDERILPEQSTTIGGVDLYGSLQIVRGDASQAIGLLKAYAPNTSPALRGEMYSISAYAEILLADLYCSGVPLSTLDFQHDFTYEPGSTEDDVYQHAHTLFDSALAISSDSASIMALASVGKGRVLLDQGKYTEAAQAVAAVPTSFQYQVPVNWGGGTSPGANGEEKYAFTIGSGGLGGPAYPENFSGVTVSSHEGQNGLPFSTANDPRVLVTPARVTLTPPSDTNPFGVHLFTPNKYPEGSVTPVVLASGIEARLIEAEAALQAGSAEWLAILNTLRTTCTESASCPTPAPAGTGGVAGLPPLDDPGSASVRVTLLFTERAYWLFLTAHRQGDLRRLVRKYSRDAEAVYPSGVYFGGSGIYGSDVNFPIPFQERSNPLFHGCYDRGA